MQRWMCRGGHAEVGMQRGHAEVHMQRCTCRGGDAEVGMQRGHAEMGEQRWTCRGGLQRWACRGAHAEVGIQRRACRGGHAEVDMHSYLYKSLLFSHRHQSLQGTSEVVRKALRGMCAHIYGK